MDQHGVCTERRLINSKIQQKMRAKIFTSESNRSCQPHTAELSDSNRIINKNRRQRIHISSRSGRLAHLRRILCACCTANSIKLRDFSSSDRGLRSSLDRPFTDNAEIRPRRAYNNKTDNSAQASEALVQGDSKSA